MIRLIVDLSHIGKKCLHAAVNGESAFTIEGVKVPHRNDGYEIFLSSLYKTLKHLNMTPQQCILVSDGYKCKEMRREFLPEYCVRPSGPKEFMEEFYAMEKMIKETVLSYGGLHVVKDYVEADDIIYFLSEKLESVVWSGDKDLLACNVPVYYEGSFQDMSKFLGIPSNRIVVWKSLVGDNSDKIPGCPNFGETAFRTMLEKYGDSCLDDLLGMLEEGKLQELKAHAADFKPFQKVLDNEETVCASYKCAKFYHPGYKLNWEQAYPKGNGEFNEWDLKIELITASMLSEEFLAQLQKDLNESPINSFDIETSMTEEGLAWSEANKKSNDKQGPLDVYGSVLAGFSITTGSNAHKTYYFPVDHLESDNLSKDQVVRILNMFPEEKPLAIHNTSFELPIIRKYAELRYDRGWLPQAYDTRILAGYCDENVSPGLKFWSRRLMNYDQVNYETVTHGLQMRELKDSEVFEYGCDDTVTSAALFRFFEVFTKYEDSFDAYVKVDLPAQYMYAEAFLNGLKFDMKRLEELQEENSHMYKELLCNIEEFLVDLQWETVEQPNVTLAMLKSGNIPEGNTIVHKWPGCEFVEAKEISPVEIKRLYKIYSGLDLKTMVRDIAKIKAMIPDFKFDTLEEMNALARSKFIATPEINLRSPKQLGELLYTALGYPVRLRNKVTDKQRAEGRREGNASTDDDAFAHAIANDATEEQKVFLKNILGAKSCLTEESLFFSPYKQMPHWEDGLVHPQSGQSLAKTGRANASFPNISQVSKISKVREVYVPSVEGNIWISLDFSGQEICHCAWQSQDENLLSCFRGEKRDVHSLCSVGIWNKKHDTPITYEEFNAARKDKSNPLHTEAKELRNRRGKRTVFLKQYGGTAVTLAVQLLVPESEAQEMLDAYDVMFPGINAWQQRKEEEYKRLGYAVSPMGRRKHLELVGDWHDKHEIRSAINMPIQCGSGEQVKLVFGELWRQRTLDKYNAIFLFSVHDEINIEASKDVAVDLIREVHKIMTQPFADFDVDIQSSIEVGRNFGTLSEVSVEFDEDKLRRALEKI